jgi:hypothetical protein
MTLSVRKALFLAFGLLLVSLVLAACAGAPSTPEATQATLPTQECPECPTCPEPTPCPEGAAVEVPYEEMWASSPHADASAEAFVHWDEDDPAVVPADCARCHSTPGMLDFLGVDGSAAGSVEADAPIGTVVTCVACHNDATQVLDTVTFPSGAEITGLGDEARCMLCHQGRASKASVDAAIEEAGVTDEDTPTEELGFVNIHYYAAAATQYGSLVQGGYQYEGKTYDAKFNHVEGYDSCIGCHNSHTLELKVNECAVCHTGVTDVESLKNIRTAASMVDYDGDGDTEEGVFYEVEGLRTLLYTAMQAYASEVAGSPIVYDVATYPYFFNDTNANGSVDEGEAAFPNAYKSWTARLAKAAYNYQVSLKDPGNFAHGGKYAIQLMYDSIENLNEALATPVDLSSAARIDAGHFAGSEEAFRHWDGEEDGGIVPGSCVKCHTGSGLPMFLAEGTTISQPATNGLDCTTCHNDLVTFTRYEVGAVAFPSGARLEMPDPDNNLCINCHQGRASKTQVDAAIGEKPLDTVDENLRFINIHYFAAGSTLFGSEAEGIYQFEGKEYLGRNVHVEGFDTCTECHQTHALTVNETACFACHQVEDVVALRAPGDEVDYDGDGSVEGLMGEIETLQAALLSQLQAYVATVSEAQGIVYNLHAYPYFFADVNGDGVWDEGDTQGYSTFTPKSLIGAYNYQYVAKDPGASAHNGKYVIQVLIDTIEYLGGDISAYTRP